MSRTKAKNSEHSLLRAKERTDLSKSQIKQMIKEAQTAGIAYANLKEGPIRDFVKSKGTMKRVKVYKNHVFVFAKTSTACITMYPLDESLLIAQEEFDARLKSK